MCEYCNQIGNVEPRDMSNNVVMVNRDRGQEGRKSTQFEDAGNRVMNEKEASRGLVEDPWTEGTDIHDVHADGY